MPLSSAADSTFDSGQGSTVYSDSQSSQQSVVLGSLADAAPLTAQSVCSPPVSAVEGPVLSHSLPSLGTYQQPATVSPLGPSARDPAPQPGICRAIETVLALAEQRQAHRRPSLSVLQGCGRAACDLPWEARPVRACGLSPATALVGSRPPTVRSDAAFECAQRHGPRLCWV